MKSLIYLFLLIGATSCQQQKAELKKPESIAITDKFMYVSNVNGPPTEVDSNGFISKLHRDGRVHTSHYIHGLNAPKGMLIVDNILYVTDIDRVLGFELNNGKKVFECALVNKCEFLNDIAYDGADHIYVSASDINEIFEVNIKNKSLRLLGLANQLHRPNGLAFHDGILYVCESGDDAAKGLIKSIALNKDSATVTNLSDQTGIFDGLAFYNNKLYVSDWGTREEEGKSQLLVLNLATRQMTPVKVNEPMTGCADFYLDEPTKTIIAPIMMNNKILFVPL